MERFRENFRNVDYVKFPTPLRPFVTRTVLVETFEVSAEYKQGTRQNVVTSVCDV